MKRTLYALEGVPYALPKGFAHSPCWNAPIFPGIPGAFERQDVLNIGEWRVKDAERWKHEVGPQVGAAQKAHLAKR
jgi:hypothetical protein